MKRLIFLLDFRIFHRKQRQKDIPEKSYQEQIPTLRQRTTETNYERLTKMTTQLTSIEGAIVYQSLIKNIHIKRVTKMSKSIKNEQNGAIKIYFLKNSNISFMQNISKLKSQPCWLQNQHSPNEVSDPGVTSESAILPNQFHPLLKLMKDVFTEQIRKY